MVSRQTCKVDRIIDRYDLTETDPQHDCIDDGLLDRWLGESGYTAIGYRSLTEWFNKRILRRAFDRNGRDTLASRIDHDYTALTGEDDLLRQDALESLEADGIDARALRDDFVSWGTMRTHLTECLGGDKQTNEAESDWERDTVAMAKSFATEKTESALSSLATKGELDDVDSSSVAVQIQLHCDHCPTRVPFEVAIEQGYVCRRHRAVGRDGS